MPFRCSSLCLFIAHMSSAQSIFSNFEGGNVNATWIDNSTLSYQGLLRCGPASSKCSPYNNWVYFRVDNFSTTAPTTLHRVLSTTATNWAQPPWYSYTNNDSDWSRFPQSDGVDTVHTFEYPTAWIAYSIPYVRRQRTHLFADLERMRPASTKVNSFPLAMSEAGNLVSAVNISSASASETRERVLIWFQARQHAWESGASWVADGVARFAASSNGSRLLRYADVVVVPIVDIDNVVIGGAGKDQQPVDFNRDWCSVGTVATNTTGALCQRWRAVRATIRTIRAAMSSGLYTDLIFVDSHSPGDPKHPAQLWTACKGGPSALTPAAWDKTERYMTLLATHSGDCGRLAYQHICNQVGPAYGNKFSGFHWNEISFMYMLYEEYPTLMNLPHSYSMSYSHETSAATVGEAHCYGAAIGVSWQSLLVQEQSQDDWSNGVLSKHMRRHGFEGCSNSSCKLPPKSVWIGGDHY